MTDPSRFVMKAMCSTLLQAGAGPPGLVPRRRVGLLVGRIIYYNPQLCDLTARSGAPHGWERLTFGWGGDAQ